MRSFSRAAKRLRPRRTASGSRRVADRRRRQPPVRAQVPRLAGAAGDRRRGPPGCASSAAVERRVGVAAASRGARRTRARGFSASIRQNRCTTAAPRAGTSSRRPSRRARARGRPGPVARRPAPCTPEEPAPSAAIGEYGFEPAAGPAPRAATTPSGRRPGRRARRTTTHAVRVPTRSASSWVTIPRHTSSSPRATATMAAPTAGRAAGARADRRSARRATPARSLARDPTGVTMRENAHASPKRSTAADHAPREVPPSRRQPPAQQLLALRPRRREGREQERRARRRRPRTRRSRSSAAGTRSTRRPP